MYSLKDPWFFTMGVSPFGYLRVVAYLQLSAAFRSLSRPSSAPDAKAFTLCSCSLELFVYLSIAVLFCSLNCLSFVKQNELNLFAVILPLLLSCSFYPPFGEIVFTLFWKDLYFTNLVNNYMSSLSVRYTQIFFIRFSMIMLPPA